MKTYILRMNITDGDSEHYEYARFKTEKDPRTEAESIAASWLFGTSALLDAGSDDTYNIWENADGTKTISVDDWQEISCEMYNALTLISEV